VVLGCFVVSRMAYRAAGVRFDETSFDYAWQFADTPSLKHDLLRTVWYAHTQPPGFNALLGIGLHSPISTAATFNLLYLAMGAVMAVILYALLRTALGSVPVAVVLSALFVVSPTCVLYENWLFYTYPEAVLLLVTALFGMRYVRNGRLSSCIACLGAVVALVWTRSLFHLVWVLVVGGILVWAVAAGRRRRTGLLVLAAFSLASLLYFKNLALYGQFEASSWTGPSLARISTFELPEEERRNLVADGTLSPFATALPFQYVWNPLDPRNPPLPTSPKTDAQVLSSPTRASGGINFNFLGYVPINDLYRDDALWVLRHAPHAYLKGVGSAWSDYFYPSAEYPFVTANRSKIEGVSKIEQIALLQWNTPAPFPDPRFARARPSEHALTVVLATAWMCGAGPWVLWRRRRYGLSPEASFLIAYCTVAVVFVAVVGNSIEVGENNRFRFVTDPLLLIATASTVSVLLKARLHRGRRAVLSQSET
jgi:hypothetical protein